jgi:hypothetical protein
MNARRRVFLVAGAALLLGPAGPAPAKDEPDKTKTIRVLLVDGQNNHDWRATSPWLKKVLEEGGRFKVEVSSNLRPGDKPGRIADTVPFPPDLSNYDVVVSNYNGDPWPKEFQKALEEAVGSGKVGLVIVHAANNSLGSTSR